MSADKPTVGPGSVSPELVEMLKELSDRVPIKRGDVGLFEEWAKRVMELSDKLPKKTYGAGLHEAERPIRSRDAKTPREAMLAAELEQLMRQAPANLGDACGELICAFLWARYQFRGAGWRSPLCWTAYSQRESRWAFFDASFVRRVRERNKREALRFCSLSSDEQSAVARQSMKARRPMILAPSLFRRVYERALDEEICEFKTELFVAAEIMRCFVKLRDSGVFARYRPELYIQDKRIKVASVLIRLGALWEEVKFREYHEKETLRGKSTVAAASVGGKQRALVERQRSLEPLRRMQERVENGSAKLHAARQVVRELGLTAKPGSLVKQFDRWREKEK